MLQLNTTVTFSLRVPLGLGYTVLDTIWLPNVRLEMVALNKKRNTKKQQQKKKKTNNKIKLITCMDGIEKKRKKRSLFRGWRGHSPVPLMRISKQVYINHQKLFGFKTSRGNYSQFLWHVRYVNDLEYLSVSEQLNYNEQNVSSSLIFFWLSTSEVWSLTYGMRPSIIISWKYFKLLITITYSFRYIRDNESIKIE